MENLKINEDDTVHNVYGKLEQALNEAASNSLSPEERQKYKQALGIYSKLRINWTAMKCTQKLPKSR